MNITNAGIRGHNPTGVVIQTVLTLASTTTGYLHITRKMALLMFILEMTEDCRLLTSLIWHGIVLTHTVMQIMPVGKYANQRAI